jgi:hypothetical protein
MEQLADILSASLVELEAQNKISTPMERLLVTSELVDPRYLHTAILTGRADEAPYVFGEEKWANFLRARLFTRYYDGPCTPDFVCEVYGLRMGVPADEVIQDTQFKDNWLGLGFSASRPIPEFITESQHAAVQANVHIEWLSVVAPHGVVDVAALGDIHPMALYVWQHRGWVVSTNPADPGCINYLAKTKIQKTQALAAICAQFNRDVAAGGDSEALSALLQKEIVSLHPARDFNGTASRLVGNWSLERAGLGRSIPCLDELLTSDQEHVANMRAARLLHEQRRQKIEAGELDPVVVFGLQAESERFRRGDITPPPWFTSGETHDNAAFETFLRALGSSAI